MAKRQKETKEVIRNCKSKHGQYKGQKTKRKQKDKQ